MAITVGQAIKDYVWRGSDYIAMHEIGPYAFVEFWQGATDNNPDKRQFRTFGAYIDGKCAGNCYSSLDEALAGSISIRHDGINTRADRYFIRGIGADIAPEPRS